MTSRPQSWYQLVLLLLAQVGAALIQNFTIDDADESIHYSENWRTPCPIHVKYCPDLKKANNGTLHWAWPSATGGSPGNITIRFAGTAVYVYNVLANVPIDP